MFQIDVLTKTEGRHTLLASTTYSAAIAAGASPAEAAAGLKEAAIAACIREAEAYRRRIADVSAEKIEEWKFKAEIADDRASADPGDLALIERGAAARGLSLDQELTMVRSRRNIYRAILLTVAAIEDETIAEVKAADLAGAADPELLISQTLAAAQAKAAAAFEQAQQALGS